MLLLATGVGSAGVVVLSPLNAPSEQLVEGHTVFTVIQPVVTTTSAQHFAAAVLVRQNVLTRFDFRAPGVLWFNDQYLTDPDPAWSQSSYSGDGYSGCGRTRKAPFFDECNTNTTRHPCLGAVIAVNRGGPAPPRLAVPPLNASSFAGTYVESYLFTGPNNHTWVEDKWDLSGRPVWTIGMNSDHNPYGEQAREHEDDGNFNCAPIKDGVAHNATSDNGYGYICGGNGGPRCAQLTYNAVVYFLLDDLDQAGTPKNHTAGSTDRKDDVSGCDDKPDSRFKDNWPCPAGNDDREGNSHAYNPANGRVDKPPSTVIHTSPNPPSPLPMPPTVPFVPGYVEAGGKECGTFLDPGRVDHGGSDDCTGDHVADHKCHATRYIDIYYGVAPEPTPARGGFLTSKGPARPSCASSRRRRRSLATTTARSGASER